MTRTFRGYGYFFKSISPFFFLIFFLDTSASGFERLSTSEFLAKAKEKGLARDRYWLILLHFQHTISGYKSLVDDPRFFLSPSGRRNPEEELNATIRALLESEEKGDSNPRCRFPSRFEWLKTEFGWDERSFSGISCEGLDRFESTLRPQSAVLVFPTFFMNNPASLFGHTLIRIDHAEGSKLLSFAVNYAAYPDSFGFLYPIKGIFGFYKGFFSIFPYYDTIKKYNDTEQRDMWEYSLNLAPEEIRRMVWHLWELNTIYSYYYFFDENCSYNLLYLMEAARPSLRLTDPPWNWTIPTDTLRAVRSENLVGSSAFRPSKGSRIRFMASRLAPDDQALALRIADGTSDPGKLDLKSREEKADLLDLAAEEIQYRYNKSQIGKESYLTRFMSTLAERSTLGTFPADPVPVPLPPEAGHRSSRATLGAGFRDGISFEELSYRPAYHSLDDPDEGFAKGLQIEFADLSLRAYNNGETRLERLDLIDIASLSPRDRFFKPLSYKIATGWLQQTTASGDEFIVYRINPGAGVAYDCGTRTRFYALAEAELRLSGEFRDRYAAGGGLEIGVIQQVTGRWKNLLALERVAYPARNVFQESTASLTEVYRLDPDESVTLAIRWDQVQDHGIAESTLNWNHFF